MRIVQILIIMMISSGAFAQESTETVEEMTIVAEQTLLSMRASVERARDEAFSAYIDINPERKFDIECFKEAPVGSHIKEEICRPRFVGSIEARMTQESLDGFGNSALEQQLIAEQMLAM